MLELQEKNITNMTQMEIWMYTKKSAANDKKEVICKFL